jgi:[glutamine synthetase] adenylyltransferase / [glutamine synthetase]-adenylyl-L-tyrosine phosphorylase
MLRPSRYLALAQAIDPERAAACSSRFAEVLAKGSIAHALATLLAAAYPALGSTLEASPDVARRLAEEGFGAARSHSDFLARILSRVGDLGDADHVRGELRRAAQAERVRIALRELLPPALGGADVDVTARELADLASATIEVALAEAVHAVSLRFGEPRAAAGGPARFTVLGMGKLGGEELNAGSDVDLVYFYDTDEGSVGPAGSAASITLHEYWTRVARRLTANLEEPTADGFVWRVDLRLRPEGRSGPLVNSLAAAERYYESFGRLWERAALLRARPVAGDRAFGEEVLATLSPFIWRRRVDPRLAGEMIGLAQRSRAELGGSNAARDLKLGPGGIREAEFFVQTLQLIWGGKEPRVRARNTLDGLRRLRAAGFVTDREAREVTEAYLALRRAEHAVQVASGVQTHAQPDTPEAQARLARALGFDGADAFAADIGRHVKRVAARFLSLLPEGSAPASRFSPAIAALERADPAGFGDAIARAVNGAAPAPDGPASGHDGWDDVARDLFELSRHPDAPLGGRTREQFEALAEAVLEAVVDAADPEQAARYLRTFFARVRRPGVYIKLLGDDARAVRRLVEALGASAFIGDALANNPELGDVVLFARGAPTPEMARAEVAFALREAAVNGAVGRDGDEAVVEALRRAKARVTLEVGLADLASQLGTREATHTLSALADAELEGAARHALGVAALSGDAPGPGVKGLVVLAMGKLGGREIGYGSDLDVLFLFDPASAPPGSDAHDHFARSARRIIQLISVSHGAGPGYDLDTRLRPSGNQGLLVTSIDAFARYHGIDAGAPRAAPRVRAAAWERLALLRARAVAGDGALGAEAMRIAHAAAYEMPSDARTVAEEIHRLRTRMERENSQERRGRYDLKLGRGGLVDVEFAVQLLQLEHGRDPRVRTTETAVAIEALAAAGYLSPEQAETLRDGYAFLRKLEQRIRILHASPAQLLEESAPGLSPLARRVGIRDRRGSAAAAELLARYREVTGRVRVTYEAIVIGRASA